MRKELTRLRATMLIKIFRLRVWIVAAWRFAFSISEFALFTKKSTLFVRNFDSRTLAAKSSSAWAMTANSFFLICERLVGPTVRPSSIATCLARRLFARFETTRETSYSSSRDFFRGNFKTSICSAVSASVIFRRSL